MKKIFFLLMMCSLSAGAFAQSVVARAVKAPSDTVDCSSVKDAVDILNNLDGGTILVCSDDEVTETITINKPMTIKAFGGNRTIKIADGLADTCAFLVRNNLTLGEEDATDTLIFDGNEINTTAGYFYVNSIVEGIITFCLRDGVHITKCKSTHSELGAVVNLENNTSPEKYCRFELDGAKIDYCSASKSIIRVTKYNKMIMSSGIIEHNSQKICIYATSSTAEVTLDGGIIQNNQYNGRNHSAFIFKGIINLGGSFYVKDTIHYDEHNIFVLSDLSKHSTTDPIIVTVNYENDIQVLNGDAEVVADNYLKFKPVDINGKQVRIRRDGVLTEKWPVYSILAGSIDTVGHLTVKAAVDTLNKYNGGTVLADSNETLTETVTVTTDIKILARGRDVTFTRGNALTNAPLIQVNNGNLTIGENINDSYQIIFDGNGIATTAPLFEIFAFLNLNGKVVMKNNQNTSAIVNQGVVAINGESHFLNNIAENGGAINNQSSVLIGTQANVFFANNAATQDGGAIYNEIEIQIGQEAVVNFENNAAAQNGGAVYNTYMQINERAVVNFVNNRAGANGGAIHNTNMHISDDGGAVVNFVNNRAGANGGAIYLTGNNLTISGAVFNFEGNRAGANGGAIYNNERHIDLSLARVKFENDSAANGGAIYNHRGALNIFNYADVLFIGDSAQYGGAIYNEDASSINISVEDHPVVFENNEASENGGAIFNANYCSLIISEYTELVCNHNQAKKGAAIYNEGRVESNGTMNLIGNIATQGGIVYNVDNWFYFANGEISGNVVKSGADNRSDNGVVVLKGGEIQIKGGTIANNIFINETGANLDTLPASLVYDASKTGEQQIQLGGAAFVDTIRLLLDGDYQKNIVIIDDNDLTFASEENPIVLIVDTLDKQIMSNGIANNYKKFKPAADTLDVNNQGWLVRKPQISVDSIYLLQAGTLYEDYGISTTTGEVDVDKIYVEYTQNVDAHGIDNITISDSTIIEMTVTVEETVGNLRQKIADAQVNGKYGFAVPFSSISLSGVDLASGSYTVEIDTLIVHTLGLAGGTEKALERNVYVPTFNIDTLNFLLAGMKFSDYEYNSTCNLSNTNDGAGDDIIPLDEIYVGYQRAEGGNVDTAYIEVTLTDADGTSYTYKEGTVSGQILTPGCGHFRQFTNSEKWTPALNLSDAFDGKDFTYTINIHTKTQGEPYFAVGTKTGTYHHEIDRECTIALEYAEACNAMGIQFAVNTDNDTITLTYPNYFNKKAVPTDMIRDNVIKVGISFAPQDEKLTMAWFDEATDITTTDGKYIVWIPISKSISETSPIVVAENYAITPDTLRLSHTDVNGVYRKTFVVKGTLTEANITPANITYHTTGASGVKFASAGGPLFKLYFDANDYTVWNVQNPTSFGKDNANVYAGLYINRPDNNVNAVYSSYRDFGADTVKPLADDLVHQLTDTAYIQYVKLGTCANQATKDYTFITKPSAAPANFTSINGRLDTVYWFVDNKFVKAERYSVNYFYAPKYTVNFNFHGGGATCNVPYSDTFADTTYVFGRPIVRPEDPFKCGNLFMDWRHGVDSFTVDSFKNIRAGIAEGTGATVEAEPFGIRSNMVIDAAWKYFVTIANPHDTAVVAHYSLCEINTRDYVWEPTEEKRPYIYTFHKDYRGKYYRDYIPGKNGNCDVEFIDDVYTESPQTLPVGQTSQVTWTVTDMCGTQFVVRQNVNVMFPPCGADNYNVDESAYVAATNNHGSLGGKYIANIDGKDYRTVRIGCNCWLKENLQNDQYANGDSIAIAKAYLDEESNVADFGRLYTWYSAVNVPEGDDFAQPTTANETITFEQTTHTYSRDYVQGICPNGWHIPALDEYQNLKDVVGAANAVKAVGSNYWLGFTDATDADHFTGIPAGYYDHSTDKYYNILGKAYFWSTDNYGVKALPCSLLYGCPEILFNEQNKFYGFSVRCVRNIKLSYE